MLVSYGPTLKVDIGFDPNYNVASADVPTTAIKGVDALVDTGATESCIDSLLAAQLNLPVVDRRMVSGVHGSKEVNVHLAQIHIPSLGRTIYGVLAAVDLVAGGQIHKALIGRTFLQHLTMVYEGLTGKVTLSY
jgi:predicted aspartyl protease